MQYYLLAVGLISASATTAIELTDYVDPSSQYEAAFVSGSLNANSSTESKQDSYNASLQGSYDHTRSSLPQSWTARLNIDANASRSSDVADSGNNVHDLNFSGSYDRYLPGRDEVFLTAGGMISSQNGSDIASNTNVDINIGAGKGRIFDATPLARILRIQEELLKYGIIEAEIADDLLLELAKIVAREEEYRAEYQATQVEGSDRGYQAFVVADIEKILKREKLLSQGSLEAVGALRIAEVLFDEFVSPRKHGWLVRAGIAGSRNISDSNSVETTPSLSLDFEFAKPYGYRGQLTEIMRVLPSNDIQRLNNKITYTYEVSDTVDWENSWDVRITRADSDNGITHIINSRYVIQVTQALNYSVGMEMTRFDGKDNAGIEVSNADTALTMSLRYRLR